MPGHEFVGHVSAAGPTAEGIPSAQVNTALQRLAAGDVRYRFPLDLADIHHP